MITGEKQNEASTNFIPQRTGGSSPDTGCVCRSNWRSIISKVELLIERRFRDSQGKTWTFFGVVHGKDDYYYGMSAKGRIALFSCVGAFDSWGFTLIEEDSPAHSRASAQEGTEAAQDLQENEGIPCVHCRGTGVKEQHYDEHSGWSEPDQPCETCKGSKRIRTVEQYLKTLPADFHQDSSLKTWFPLLAEELERLRAENALFKQAQSGTEESLGPTRRATIAQAWGG